MKTYLKILLLIVVMGPLLASAKTSLTCESAQNTPDQKSYPIFVLYFDLEDPEAEAELWKEQQSPDDDDATYWVGLSIQAPVIDGDILVTDNDYGDQGRILIETWGPGPGESRLIIQLKDTGFYFTEQELSDYVCR